MIIPKFISVYIGLPPPKPFGNAIPTAQFLIPANHKSIVIFVLGNIDFLDFSYAGSFSTIDYLLYEIVRNKLYS
jgi:hypothetical protein